MVTAPVVDVPWEQIVELAARAPSVHNTQPWAFRVVDGPAIELRADLARRLPVEDPNGREMHLSCGAALFGLRLACRSFGFSPVVEVQPDPVDATLLARVTLRASLPAQRGERELVAAMGRRHTHRRGFSEEAVPPAVLLAMQDAAAAEGASLHLVEGPVQRDQLAETVLRAVRRQQVDIALREEVRSWAPLPRSERRDGVPATAYPRGLGMPREGELAQRDFAQGRTLGVAAPAQPPGSSVLAVLTTPGDARRDWLAGGAALHRLLLVGAHHWVFANMHSQPLQVAQLRHQVSDLLGLPRHAQMVMSLGLARVAPVTPRRPVDDVLETKPLGWSDSACT